MKTAIVTGMTGQDGPYLAQHLISQGYKVFGLIRRYSNPNLENLRWLGIEHDVHLITGDLTDDSSLNQIVRSIRPDEFYNLGAQSFVGASWDLSKVTTEVNALGTLNCLNAIRQFSANTRFYQASTSEMFGNSNGSAQQNELSPFCPRSPYGVSKLYAHWITRNYRESYGMFSCSGILFNHESPLRGPEFVTRKITQGVAKIKLGLAPEIVLGNLDTQRDWGHARDFVKAMWSMLQQPTPDDYVIATGQVHTVRECVEIAFDEIGIADWKPFVRLDSRFQRPAEIYSLCGDYSKATGQLGWQPETSFESMIREMVRVDLQRLK